MNRTAVKSYAIRARRDFQQIVAERAHALGIGADKIAKVETVGDMLVINGQPFSKSIEISRWELVNRVQNEGFDIVVENIAYTLFNRFCALRFMEVNSYLSFRVFSSTDKSDTPDILKHAMEAAEELSSSSDQKQELQELKLAGDQDQKLYSMLLLAQCNTLSQAMPFLFEKPNDITELLMPENLLHSDSVVRDLVDSIDEADWKEIEIVGWLYQFYISEKKDQVIGKVVSKEDIPAATQLFTPKWIVQYMVENSLGRLWMQSHPESGLKSRMQYYIEDEQENEPQIDTDAHGLEKKKLVVDTPDEISCMDPCCGSGHVLVYMFDLLYAMYEESGYIQRDIPRMILENNLHGIDIDERAAQLTGFALMMKARERDPKFLDNAVQPQVIAIEESNNIDLQAEARIEGEDTRSPFEADDALIPDESLLPTWSTTSPGGNGLNEFAALVRLFKDAKNYGSLLRVPESIFSKLDTLEKRIDELRGGDTLFATSALPELAQLVQQARLLSDKYHAVVTNPPYMGGKGMNTDVKAFAKTQYPDSKSDLFAMFIERDLGFLQKHGLSAMVTMQSWMFLSSYEKLRAKILDEYTISSMAHLGARGFDSIGGEVVQTTAFVLKNSYNPDHKGVYLRLVDGKSEAEKRTNACEAISNPDCGWFFRASATDFKKIPGSPIAYWVAQKLGEIYKDSILFEKMAHSMQGMITGDNNKFLRRWFETSFNKLSLNKKHIREVDTKECYWIPYNKGGDLRKWFGNNEFVLNWQNEGQDLTRSRTQNAEYYFKPCITWTFISSVFFAARICEQGFVWDVAGSSAFPQRTNSFGTLLSFMCSKVGKMILDGINPTLNYQVENILALPIHKSLKFHEEDLQVKVDILVNREKQDWNSYETSWGFTSSPLRNPDYHQSTLQANYQNLSTHWQATTQKMQRLEEENNRIFIETYGLQDELTPDVPLKEITLTCNPRYRYKGNKTDEEYEQLQRTDTMKELISYAVGCMMGRYSPDTPGLQFAGGEYDHDEACKNAASFTPDADGILPILGDHYFEDDVTARFVEFLKETFGPEKLTENLHFVAEAIGIKGSETPQDTIRRFLANDFFKYHTKMYKKRPIYWLFSSGKEKAFQALVYLHRYTPATLARMRTGYLHELQNKMRAQIDDMEAGKGSATTTVQSNRISRDLTKLNKQLEELRLFDEKLHHYADQRIEIDLDDGVKNNYGLFGDLLADVKAITGKKK